MSTVKANTYQDASGGSNAILYGAASPAGSMGFRNRIINGDMRIDQRNAGASVTLNSGNQFPVDRMNCQYSGSGTITAQRSTTAPDGFVNSLLFTVTTGSSPAAGVVSRLVQPIEGLNTADLGFGTANAKTVTLSFWVRSSLTGTFGGGINAGSANGVYVFNYTISSANTWEHKTITVPGATVGTWYTDNNAGVSVFFDLGSGSNFELSAGSWSTSINKWRSSGNVQLSATTGATFYITGVQLEVGSVATEFERRPYGTELQLCQRYYEKSYNTDTAVGTNTTDGMVRFGGGCQTNDLFIPISFKVSKRAAPSMSAWQNDGTSGNWYYVRSGAAQAQTVVWNYTGTNQSVASINAGTTYAVVIAYGQWAANAEL